MKCVFAVVYTFLLGLGSTAVSQTPKPAPPLPLDTQQQKQAPAPDSDLIRARSAEESARPTLPPKASLDNLVVNARGKKVAPKSPYDSKEGRVSGRKLQHQIDQTNAYFQKAQQQLNDLKAKEEVSKKLFNAWAEKVCQDNGWDPKEYKYDISSDTWYHVAPTPAK